MARHKKPGKRDTGIQSKKGYLYFITNQKVFDGESMITKKKWISTGLKDTPENLKKAIEMHEQLLGKHADMPQLIDKNITLQELSDLILEEKQRDVLTSTLNSYQNRSKNIMKHLGIIKVRDITRKTIEEYLDSLFIIGKLQERTVKDLKAHLATILDKAIQLGLIASNPAKEAKINKSLAAECAKEKSDDNFFSYREAQRFLELSKNHKLYKLFYITLFFGLRRQEVLGLRWCAIDFTNRIMYINHTVTKVNKGVKKLNKAKNKSSIRQYPLTDEQIELFKELKKEEEENRKLFGASYLDTEYIFKHEDGTLYHPDTISDDFRDHLKSLPELPQKLHFHNLRTSCVSILVHENMNIKAIQQWVGHKCIETTLKIYAKVKEKEEKQAVSEKMRNVIPLK